MRIRQHSLSIFFGVIFLVALALQSVAGLVVVNEEHAQHGEPMVTWADFVTSSDFVVDVAENWQSEYLQFFLFILTTIWLIQKGSPESKQPGEEGVGTDEDQLVGRYARADSPAWARAGGWRLWVYSNSLLLTMGGIFLLSWLAQALAGQVVYNQEQTLHGDEVVGLAQYAVSADFWNRTLQNWQSEFLAVGSMVALSIVLRQRGSSESKPVGTPHEVTAVEG
ncbi:MULTISPECIES: DUF6766 family protein [unclassified Agromyces]|uniref:DUF6766 family protein n=1 Tax=unclassified Agromyces TaxID=2639701 RepID=UPI00301468AA